MYSACCTRMRISSTPNTHTREGGWACLHDGIPIIPGLCEAEAGGPLDLIAAVLAPGSVKESV